MMVTAYLLGQKYYPVPYRVKGAAAYLVAALVLFLVQMVVRIRTDDLRIRLFTATFCFALFLLLIFKKEGKELRGWRLRGL